MLSLPDHYFTLLKLCQRANKQLGLVLQIASQEGVSWSEHCAQTERGTEGLQKRLESIAPSAHLAKPLGAHIGRMHSAPASPEAQHLTYLEASQTLNGSGRNQFGKYKSAYIKTGFPLDHEASIPDLLEQRFSPR